VSVVEATEPLNLPESPEEVAAIDDDE